MDTYAILSLEIRFKRLKLEYIVYGKRFIKYLQFFQII